jgi:site-specific DNA-methyltransferase (adenine-specific)
MKNRIPMKDDWITPKEFLKELKKEFGNNMFDPCPLNSKFDGLVIEWGKINFINPPYSRKLKEAFILKAFEESKKNKICIMLLPVSTSTKIFHEIIYPNAELRFIRRRLKFNGLKTSGQMDNMLVIFRENKSPPVNGEKL